MPLVLSDAMHRRRLFPLILAGLTLFLAVLILTDWVPALRGPAPETSEWHWLYELRPQSRWWLPLLVATGIWLFSVWWLRQQTSRIGVGLTGLVVGSLALQLTLVYAHRPEVAAELVDRTLSNETNGYFTVAAATTDLNTLLRDFPQVMPTLPSEHTRTHPPGLILAQWLTMKAAAAPLASFIYPLRCTDLWLLNQPAPIVSALAVWAFLPLLAAAFTAIPLYFLGHQLYDVRVARLSAIFGATLPALLIFAPTPDQLFALLSAVILLIWLVAVQRRSSFYAFLAGLLLSITTFFSLGNGALLLVLAVFALYHPHLKSSIVNRQSKIAHLKWLLWFIVGLASVWLIYWLGWGVAPWAVARVGLQQHYELVTSLRRYDWWVVYNLVDLFIFAGPIVVVGFAAALLTTIRSLILPKVSTTMLRDGTNLRQDTGLILALALLILVLDLSGSARGEVGRLWLFFMPLLAVVATGQQFSRSAVQPVSHSALSTQHSALLFAAQLILALSIGLAWKPIEAVIAVAERPQMPTTIPTHEVTVPFGETIQLTGYDWDTTEAGPGGVLKVTLYWEAEGAAARPYTVFTHLVNQNGDLVAQKDNWPVNGLWPPTCWQPGEVVVDPYTIPLPPDLPAGTYSLMVGLYDADTNTRLLTPSGQDALQLVDDLTIDD